MRTTDGQDHLSRPMAVAALAAAVAVLGPAAVAASPGGDAPAEARAGTVALATAAAADGARTPAGDRTVQVTSDPREEVLAVVRGLFDAMAERDTAAARALLARDARFLRVDVSADTAARRWRDGDAFLRTIAGDGPTLLETIHDPDVTVAGSYATVRAGYEFRIGGEFSHCGRDVFHLTRGPDGWVLASVVYTVQPDRSACAKQSARASGSAAPGPAGSTRPPARRPGRGAGR